MMFMNAEPRLVLNDFETLVSVDRAELMHQRIVEMTNKNNDMSIWASSEPVASSQNGSWNQRAPLDAFGSIETPQELNVDYGKYFLEQPPTPMVPPAVNHLARAVSYTNSTQQTYGRSLMQHHDSAGMINQFQEQDPMLATPDSQWDYGRDSLMEFVASQPGHQGYQGYQYNSNDTGIKPSGLRTSVPSYLASQPSMNYNMTTSSTNATMWIPPSMAPLHQSPFGYPPTHHGLPYSVNTPGLQPQQQQGYEDLINWSQADNPSTISPKQLHLANVLSPARYSDSASGLEISSPQRDSSSGADDSDYAASERSKAVEEPTPTRPTRQKLPNRPGPHRQAPILTSNDFRSTTKAKSMRHNQIDSSQSARRSKGERGLKNVELSSTSNRLQPNGATPTSGWNGTPQSIAQAQAMPPQNSKDEYLVNAKKSGMSYKKIKAEGGFTEAESTLRGRFRTLTKHKTARVRKPAWTYTDVALLRKAVHELTRGADPNRCKVPWKQVAEYIANNGGSYHFGNATCRKEWDKLQK